MEPFYLKTGQTLLSLHDLADALKTMSPEVFCHHVNENRNDFAEWLTKEDTLLADLLRDQIEPFVMERLIRARLAYARSGSSNLARLPTQSRSLDMDVARDGDLADYFKSATLSKPQFYGLMGRAYEYLTRRDIPMAKQIYAKLKDAYQTSPLSEADAQRLYEGLQDLFYEVYMVQAELEEQQ